MLILARWVQRTPSGLQPHRRAIIFKKPWLALKACARPGSACPVEPEEGEVCERVTVLSGAGDPELSFIGDTDWLLLLAGEKSSDRDRAGEGVEVPPTEPVPIEEDDPAAAAAARCARANWAFALMSARVRAPVRPGRMLGGCQRNRNRSPWRYLLSRRRGRGKFLTLGSAKKEFECYYESENSTECSI